MPWLSAATAVLESMVTKAALYLHGRTACMRRRRDSMDQSDGIYKS